MKRFATALVNGVRITCDVCAVIVALYFLALFGLQFLHGLPASINGFPLLYAVATWALKGLIDWALIRAGYELQSRSKRAARRGLKPLDA